MDADLDTLLTALYWKVDDDMKALPGSAGRPPLLSDAEVVCLAIAQAMLGFTPERRWLRFCRTNLAGMFPHLPLQPGYNKRLRSVLGLIKRVIRDLARDTDYWFDNHWITDSTPGRLLSVVATPGSSSRC